MNPSTFPEPISRALLRKYNSLLTKFPTIFDDLDKEPIFKEILFDSHTPPQRYPVTHTNNENNSVLVSLCLYFPVPNCSGEGIIITGVVW